MKTVFIILSAIFYVGSSPAYVVVDEFGDGERVFVQEVVKQTRSLGKKKGQTYICIADGDVYMYSSPRGAIRRKNMDESDIEFEGGYRGEESYVQRKVKKGEKLRIIPLSNGIGVIRRPKQKGSFYYVVMSHFITPSEYEKKLAAKNAPKPEVLKLGAAEFEANAVAFWYRSDYDRFLSLSAQADEASVMAWLKALVKKQRAYIAQEGEDVVILKIDGSSAEILWQDKEAWTKSSFLRSK